MAKKDEFTRKWITENSIEIISQYSVNEKKLRRLRKEFHFVAQSELIN